MPAKIILCIPGLWPTPRNIVRAIAEHSGGWLFAGVLLMEMGTNRTCEVEVAGPDPRLVDAFVAAGYGGRIDPEILPRIAEHKHILYVLCDRGSLDAANAAVRTGAALLRSGGLAVKVESAGVAHGDVAWRALAKDDSGYGAYRALVTLVAGEQTYYSCGMHAFGLPEASVPRSLPLEEAAALAHQFNVFQIIDSPRLKDGATFSTDADAPRYRLRHRPCTMYRPDDLFHNEAGIWHLESVE